MEKQTPVRRRKRAGRGEVIHAVQCGECFKWRVVPSREEFEEIRSTMIEKPFVCSMKKGGSSCEEAGDIEYDSSRIWAIEKPGLPKTPDGFKIDLVLRSNFSKFDPYYTTPTGEKLRATSEMISYLKQHPEFQGTISISDFTFVRPKLMAHTLPNESSKPKRTPVPTSHSDDENKH